MWRNALVVAALLACGLTVGCAEFTPPDGYVKLKDSPGYDVKAVSARGNVIALTSRPNEDRTANLDFWAAAVEYQKVDLDGMKLADREAIRSAGGLDGVLFRFETGEGRAKLAYLVALYVTPTQIHTMEATGPAEALLPDLEKLKKSMQSLR